MLLPLIVMLVLFSVVPIDVNAQRTSVYSRSESSSYRNTVHAYHDSDGNVQYVSIDPETVEHYFEKNNLEYYAYMDIHGVEEHLIPVVLEARTQLINAKSWVDDELDGWIEDQYGNVIEIVPQFHDLFPEDWEIPCFPPEHNKS